MTPGPVDWYAVDHAICRRYRYLPHEIDGLTLSEIAMLLDGDSAASTPSNMTNEQIRAHAATWKALTPREKLAAKARQLDR